MNRIFGHPLAEEYPASPETGNEETINSWMFAVMIANVATGREPEGDHETAIKMARELIGVADSNVNVDALIIQAFADDAAMAMMINLLNEGIEIKLDEAL